MKPNVLSSRCDAAAVNLQRAHGEAASEEAALIEEAPQQREGRLRWTPPGEQERADHANELKASEDGAEAVAIVTAFRAFGYRTVGRARHASGCDLLLRRDGESADDVVRLEVSGIVGHASATRRLDEKVNQLQNGNLKRPGVAMVVVFQGAPIRILMERVP